LIVLGLPVVLEPIDKSDEWSLILLMEVETLRSDFDELFDDFLAGDVGHYNMLVVLR
jgi:hypothetical protein